ncbi:MAG: C-terminal target protein [Segetibacter sp.]|nr:C-terminal target protein [Segetibacter sp.]
MTYSSVSKWPLILLTILIFFKVAAQQPLDNLIASKKSSDGRYNFLKFNVTGKGQLRNVSKQPEDIKRLLGLGSRHSFVTDELVNNNLGFKRDQQGADHVRYRQYFNGVEIEYGVITLHLKDGALNVLTGEYFNIDDNFSTTPLLSVKAALDKAIAFIGAKKYSWEDGSISNRLLKSVPKGELVICRNYIQQAKVTDAGPKMELAYKFAIYATEPLRYDYIYVSARTGNIIHVNPIIKHADGIGATRYSGTKTIATTLLSSGNYILKDSGGNYNISTYNLNRGTNYSNAVIFSDNNNNWTAQEFNNGNLDNAALDAHWGAMKTQDYWRTVHNRNSFDNKGTRINNYIHYGNFYSNAFWDGSVMTYGDGDGNSINPLTSVDICGHEIGHAVCQYTANLTYAYESGAINEGFSDIWGACIKRFADPSKNTWQMGDEISNTGNPIRSMSNPKSQAQPDTYKGINWYTGYGDNGGVHINSGIMNHWFYILTEGKAGTNDKGTAYRVTGIGITKAAQIAYRSENFYLYPNAVYADTRIAAIQAAEDLFGAGSNEVLQTTEAWNAVGVYDALARPDSVTAAIDNNNVVVKWRFNTFQSISGFKIQRAINGTNVYANIATVGAEVRSFTDARYINNSLNQYRIRSFRDSSNSDYSDVASVAVGNAPFIMSNGTFTKCGVTFFDPGGQNNYNSGYYTTTVKPEGTGDKLRIAFSEFNVSSYDSLKIYNGPTPSSPLLGSFTGITLPPVLESSAAGGELTFVFNTSYYNTAPGWKAYISCFRAIAPPTNLSAKNDSLKNVHLTWTDNASDEPGYLLERSVNDSIHFQPVASLPSNTTSYKDSSAPDNSYIYYRVKAFGDSAGSPYSNIAPAKKGNLYAMQNGVVTTCGITFLDPGSPGNFNTGNYTTTFRPATPGNKVKVAFSQFDVNYNYLYIYNGPSSSSPFLGSYSGSTMPPVLQSTALGGELTFVFNSYYSNSGTGWASYISCYKPVATPANLNARSNDTKNVQLSWSDNADDETAYVVERSLNDSLHFLSLITLPANTTSYNDTSAGANSFIFYRIKAYRDTVSSLYSNSAPVFNGHQYVMQNGSYTTCDVTFLDPGGAGNYGSGSYTTTIRPATAGNNLKITFTQFNVGYDNLYIYNGPSSLSPLLGSYSGTSLPPLLKSTAPGGELTFAFNSYNSTNPGWVANVSCYKTVGKPSGVKGITETPQTVKLTWSDNADDETKYIIERSVNASTLFKSLVELPSNTSQYIDSAAPANSLLYYRVRAFRDTLASLYSDTAAVSFGNGPFLMRDSTVITCDKVFMDPGGADVMPQNSNYSTYYNLRTTFKPAIPGNSVKVTFSNFKLNGSLSVYNGSSSNSPFIGNYSSYNTSNINSLNFSGTGADGSLTFVYQGYSNGDSGWVAQVSCYKPVAKPSGLHAVINSEQRVVLNWTDYADDETKYVVERSVNASSLYTRVTDLPFNSTQFTDSAAPANSLLYYRVKAYRDTIGSFYSDTASISFGNVPFLMKDSTLITCDKVFMDGGGADVIPSGYYSKTVTFKPAISGNNIEVTFSKFNIGNGTFTVYNGSSTSSPHLGSFWYSSGPGVLRGTGPDGSLTFVYSTSYSFDSGWVAQVSCYKPVAKPSGVNVIEEQSKKIKITWSDNADNETKYVVERSVNGTSQFTTVAEVAANNTTYFDTSAPVNNFLYYRVRGYRDSLSSFYSDTASIAFGNAPFLMLDSTLFTCDKVFMDPGGADKIQRSNQGYINIKTTFRPAINGNNIKVSFSQFQLSGGALSVYDGLSTSSPLIGNYTYYTPRPQVINATGPEGALTFVLTGYVNNDSGWVAQVGCYKPVASPSGLVGISDGSKQVALTWTDNADDETRYVVERSVNAPSLYTVIAELPSGAINFIDSAAPVNSLIFYRVKAYRDTLGSNYSDTATVGIGNAPFLMKDSTVTTCDKVFMDGGGVNIVTRGNYYTRTTFKPGIDGNNIRVTFSKLRISGTLDVYDGSSNAGRLIGRFSGVYPNSLVFDATGMDGSLTFQYQSYNEYDSGWVAQVSCYKPVAKPSGLRVVSQTLQEVKLSWTDNADDETKFIVERSVNGYSQFTAIGQVAANTNGYTDNAPPPNSFVYYRVRAYRDTLKSLPSDTASVALGNTPFLMKDSTVFTCNKVFMDPGGADVIPQPPSSYYNIQTTFKPEVSGNSLKAVFSKFKLNYYGNLLVYNGASTNSPLLATLNEYSKAPITFKSSGPDGALTFVYRGYRSDSDSGWVAQISCFKPVNAPGNLSVDTSDRNSPKLNWTDNANNETGYVIERSLTDSFHYQSFIKLPANTTSYIDTAAPRNSFLYYRVASYIDTSNSDYSNAVSVVTGVPFIMRNTTVTTCGIVFLDPGGLGNHPAGSYTTTVKPATAGNVVRVQFSEFNAYGTLYIYNGPSTSSPLLGNYSGTTLPPLLQSTAPGGELTFVFNPYYSNDAPGWIAYLSCYKPVLKPTGIKATADSSAKVNITWNDNADDETKYIVERSDNAPSLYKLIAELPANSSGYIDSTAPANRLLYYRVRAYRDTAGSNYSDTASVAFGDVPFIMKDSILITCDKVFMDPGGRDVIPNAVNSNTVTTTTFKPAVEGNKIRVAFSSLKFGAYLYVYNGASASSPLITMLSYYSGALPVFNSTAADGSLTFVYRQYASGDSGWVAQVSCYKPVAKPTGMKATADTSQKVKITWTDNADDETKYIIERSENAPFRYVPLAQLASNSTQYIDSTAPANSLLYYRVKAFRDTLGSFYSDTAAVAFGNAPFLMKDSTLITCDKVFMDAGGIDVIPTSNTSFTSRTTFKPAIAGNKIKVVFSKLRLNGYISVYNGASESSPYIGIINSNSFVTNPVFTATGEDGALTFVFTTYSSYMDSGWVAQVSCYKPVAKPSGVKAIADSSQQIKVTWTDNANDETRYVLERSDNAPGQFKIVAQLPSDAKHFTDSTAPINSILYYRVKAYRDTLSSFYSDTAAVASGNAPFLMKDSTLITCDKVFMDPGGADVIPSNIYNTIRTTFKPGTGGNKIKVAFSKISLKYGYVTVYDGSSTNSPMLGRIGNYYSNTNPSSVFMATGAEGSLTLVYQNQSSYYSDSGWIAQVSCFKLPEKPNGLKATADSSKIVLSWKDNAEDETNYVVERSMNAPSQFKMLAQLPANTTKYVDSTVPAKSLLYYRVRAFRDTDSLSSPYSDTATVAMSDAPFLMKDSTIITCDKVFMDPGGTDVIPSGIYYNTSSTFRPGVSGNNVKVAFSKMLLNGTLSVFDGSSTSSPLIGTLGYYFPNAPLVYSATGPEGSLTFLYRGSPYSSDSGWMAQVSCFKSVATPGNLTAHTNNLKNVNLSWTDNANDETHYSLERSFNDSLHFLLLKTLPANSTSYTDTTTPENSYIFYRVRSYRNSVASGYSNTVFVLNGNVFTMRGGKVSDCGITFLDPGGDGNYPNNSNYTTTFTSPAKGGKIRVVFDTFNSESCCDYLNVYNGPDASFPLLGTYLGSNTPPVLQSSASNGELTFVFTSDKSSTAAGWKATVSCINANDTLATCSTDTNEINTIQTDIIGSTYRWQKFNGKSFVNIYDDINKSGTTTHALHIKNAGLSVLEKFRCIVNGISSVDFVLLKGNQWTGKLSSDWNDPQNWSCAKVPDGNTDVLIDGGRINNPVLNNNGECHSIKILSGGTLHISSGYNLTIQH